MEKKARTGQGGGAIALGWGHEDTELELPSAEFSME